MSFKMSDNTCAVLILLIIIGGCVAEKKFTMDYNIEQLKIEQKAIVHGESDTEVREKK